MDTPRPSSDAGHHPRQFEVVRTNATVALFVRDARQHYSLEVLSNGLNSKSMRRQKVKVLFSAALALFFLHAAVAGQSRNVDEKSLAYEADNYLNGLVKEDRFSGAVLLARGGKIVLSKGYGLANRETGTPNSARTKIS